MQRVLIILLLAVLSGLFLVRWRQDIDQTHLILNHVTVIDVTTGRTEPDMAVEIRQGRISKIRPASEEPVANRGGVIDATGKFVVPGLWDMHVHVLREDRVDKALPMLLANGVLGIRDMGSSVNGPAAREWHRRLEEGGLPTLRLVAAGPMLDGAEPMFPETSLAVTDEDEARQDVELLKQGGSDFVKVYSLLAPAAYFAVADEATKQGLPFAGHVPDSVRAGEASDAGQKSIEHLSGILLACSRREDEIRGELLRARAGSDMAALHDALQRVQTEGAETFDGEKAKALFARFARNGTWQVPTLVGVWNAREETTPGNGGRVRDLLQGMREAGVGFMAGTDAPSIWAVVGQSLHKELALFVRAGFTPLEALQTATRNPAAYLGLLDSFGTVEEGKAADLVLLEANPLEDIANTKRIAAVVLRGNYIPVAALLDPPPSESRQ